MRQKIKTEDQIWKAQEHYRQALLQLKERLEALLRDPRLLERAAAGIGLVQPFFLPYQGQNDRDLQQV
ncbi:MAG: hypothetical protein ACUVRV_04630 [Cyanobacteriota bacterium]